MNLQNDTLTDDAVYHSTSDTGRRFYITVQKKRNLFVCFENLRPGFDSLVKMKLSSSNMSVQITLKHETGQVGIGKISSFHPCNDGYAVLYSAIRH